MLDKLSIVFEQISQAANDLGQPWSFQAIEFIVFEIYVVHDLTDRA